MKEFTVLPEDKEILNLLKKIKRFNEISDKDLQLFIKAGKFIEYEPNETIIKEGAVDSWAYFLLSGTLKIQKKGRDIGTLKRLGDVFGKMDSLGGTASATSVVAVSKSIILSIDTSFVNEQLQSNNIYFSYMIYRIFAEVQAVRLRHQIQENERLGTELDTLKKCTTLTKRPVKNEVAQDFSNKKILLVDHVESTRKILKTILREELNCNKVFEVINGQQALTYLTDKSVDLVIAELNLPNMSGLDLLNNVKMTMSERAIPFIFVCSDSSIDKIKQGAKEDITHYKSTQCIIKPFNANTVIEKVKKTFIKADKKKRDQKDQENDNTVQL